MDESVTELSPIVSDYYLSDSFVSLIIGPIGSGKTLGSILKWEQAIHNQEPSKDGIRYTRTAVIRNTAIELRDTTIKSFEGFFGDQLKMNWGNLTALYEHGDVHAEILFRALDKPGDMKKLLSLEITFAYLNELRELPKEALENVTSRLGRYPSPDSGVEATHPHAWADTNAFDNETWIYKKFIENKPSNHNLFEQPPGIINAKFNNGSLFTSAVNPEAENLDNLPSEYYKGFIEGKSESWVRVMIMREYIPLQVGKPVYPEYNDHIHCIDEKLIRPATTERALICSADNGRWSGFLVAQVDTFGRIVVFDEITSSDMNLIDFGDVVSSSMKSKYSRYKFETWIDPWAANQRGQLTDDTMFKVWQNKHMNCRTSRTNSPTIMVTAVKSLFGKMINGQPALVISSRCKNLRKGLNGGYQFKRMNVSGENYAEKPDKGMSSHICNALEFLVDGTGASVQLRTSDRMKEYFANGGQSNKLGWNAFG